jgi:hypothetical protein
MKNIAFKSANTKKLKKKEIISICKLKNTQWKYGLKSQLKWFNENIKNNDIHNLLYLGESLVGYNLLRKRKFLFKGKFFFYLYFDTIIVLKKYRKMKIGKLICQFSAKIIKKAKLHSILICQNELLKFYKKYEWEKIAKKNFNILDHEYPKDYSAMSFNQTKTISKNKIKYFIY